MQVPLVVSLYENANFGGRRRVIIQDTPNLALQGFDNMVSSVKVQPGPGYATWKVANPGKEPTVGLYEYPSIFGYYSGAVLTLTVGDYPNIMALYNYDNIISAVRFNPASSLPIVFPPIPLIVEIFADANFNGIRAVIVENVRNVQNYLGVEFENVISSIKVSQGPDYVAGNVAKFFDLNNYQGASLDLAPGNYTDLAAPPYMYTNVISSIKIRP